MKTTNIKKTISCMLVLMCIFSLVAYNVDAAKKIKSKSVKLNVTNVTMATGDIACLDALMNPVNSTDRLTWKSSNKKIAKVSPSGVVTATSTGQATITVFTSSGKMATCVVNVKAYLTKSEVLSLIRSNTLTESDVTKMIKNNTLSKDEIIELIKEHTVEIDNDAVVELINANTLSEADVVALIKSNTLSKDDILKLINESSSVLSEDDVLKLIKENTLDEDEIYKIVENKSLTEEKIIELIKEYSLSEDDVKRVIASTGLVSHDWEDGEVIPVYYDKKEIEYPLVYTHSWQGSEPISCQVNNVIVRKYHTSDIFMPYKYEITYSGTVSKEFMEKELNFSCYIELYSSNIKPQSFGDFFIDSLDNDVKEDLTFNRTYTYYSEVDWSIALLNGFAYADCEGE